MARAFPLCLALILAACGGGGGGGFAGLPAAPAPSGGTPSPDSDPPAAPPATVAPKVACTSLAGMDIAAGRIGLPTQGANVASAVEVAADEPGNALGAHCRVRGSIRPIDPNAPLINFQLNLPQQWNQKLIHFGGGGFNGRLIDGTETVRFGPPDKPAPLALGYATFGDDSGHQSSSITDGRFAADDESLANYGGQSLKKTHDVVMQLVQAHYGGAPKKTYFLGTSTGGRDALAYIQRWPADYDGVIANEPALNYSGTRLSNVAVGRALYANGGAGWLNIAKTLLVQRTVLQACDRLDGAVDAIVSNVESCRLLNAQILASLRCSGGTDNGDGCLSDAQLATVRTIESPLVFNGYSLANGVTRAGGYNLLEGALVAGPYTTRNLGTRPVPANPATSADANMYVTGDQWVKFFVTRLEAFDSLGFDPVAPGSWSARVAEVSAITDATNPQLSPFLARGGRLILLHGLADEVISPNSTIDYYQQLIATVGADAVERSVRFYTVPGMGHGTGVFIPSWDSLAALESWVEGGLAPATGVAMDTVAGSFGRTRPLCRFPAWPKYRGSGSLDAAINYSCVQEVGDPLACPHLPGAATHYKGGNSLGEELDVLVDPATLAYTVTIDASLDRAAGTQRTGTLTAQGQCKYASAENGAVFSFAAGGVLQGGVAAPAGGSFTPLIAFQNSFENAATPTVFNPVANIFNAAGAQQGAGAATPYAGAVRLRNAGTFQYCRDPVTNGFMSYDPNCTQTEKGYISWVAARQAFDVRTTSPSGGATTTGGTLTGSMVIGLVGGSAVPLHLVRESATNRGMRLMAPQQSLAAGAADGLYAMASVQGETREATVAGSGFNLGGAAAGLSYDTPVPGVAQADAGRPGHFIFNQGVLAFVSSSGASAALDIGVRH
nr:tannase/feruloyl esterase family alpha/beta hydrolase [Variovorax sp. JS1663]